MTWRRWRVEAAFAACVLLSLAASPLRLPFAVWLLATLAALPLGAIVSVRVGRAALSALLWRLRNRLIVAYLFIAVIPVVLLLLLTGYGSRYLAEQAAAHLVHSELDRSERALWDAASAIAGSPAPSRDTMAGRMTDFLAPRFPGLSVSTGLTNEDEGRGLAVRQGRVFLWARARHGESEAALLAPVTRTWLAALVPGLGDVTLLHLRDPERARLADEPGAEAPAIPEPANRFDSPVLWGIPVAASFPGERNASGELWLSVRSRVSAVWRLMFREQSESPLSDTLKALGFLLLLVQAISVVIGVSLTRTITEAVAELYEGTRHVTEGDFAHRIRIRGSDQLAALGGSFNQMTAHIEELIQVAKEKERIEAEIEIARQVQGNLFPKTMPAPRNLELAGHCEPARSVSGDYYDCQTLPDGRIAIALGDVAGKGISAALLMASLQASLRSQLRECADWPGSVVSTSRMVTRLNQQLYATTSPEKYATFFLAVYDDESGLLTYTNAGHLPPVLVRGGEASTLEVTGTVVGMLPMACYEEAQVRLERGDLLVLYTDGVTEPENEFGEMFGPERLTRAIQQCDSLAALAPAVLASVRQFTGASELQDDLTMLAMRRR